MDSLADIAVITTVVQALRILAHIGDCSGILLSALECCAFAALCCTSDVGGFGNCFAMGHLGIAVLVSTFRRDVSPSMYTA